ncbi:MAG: TonB-dependent receptor [Proteobacteria bacterium]|nr:TonB-dependent receptor [Pseudomonadota bacterium]
MHTKLIRNTLVNSIALALFLSAGAHAQSGGGDQATSDTQKNEKKTTQLEGVVVTGSRIARSEVEGPAPVTVISGDEMKKQGFTTVYELVGSLTQSFPTQTPPSWGSTTVNARQADLRGLGANRTLILLDGRRIDDYPQPAGASRNFQNLNNIPTGMIDRVEILATGASAIYGSDAISGVINIILKHQYDGYDVDFKVGRAERGGRNYYDFNFTGGNSGENWHIVYNFEAQHRSALWGRDRPYTDSEADAGYGAWNKNARAFGWSLYQAMSLNDVNGNYISPPSGACTQSGYHNYYTLRDNKFYNSDGSIGSSGLYCAQKALFRDWVLTPGRDDRNGYVYGSYDLPNNMQAYGAIGLWRTTGISNTQLPFLYAMGGLPNGFYDKTTGQVITNYFRQFIQTEIGGTANTYDREQNWDIHGGLKGTILDGRFSWDANIGRSMYWVHEAYAGLNEQGMFDFFFGPQQGTTTIDGTDYPTYQLDSNRFWNPITPQQYRTFGVWGENRSISWMNQAQATVTGDLFDIWGGPVAVAAVVEANHQGFQLYPDARGNDTHFGDPFQDYTTGGGERTRYSGGVEFKIPLHSTFTVSLAGRIDKYDDASIANIARTGNIKLEWHPFEGLFLRGTYGTNFHAPDMQYIYKNPSVQQVGIYADPYYCITHGDTVCAATQHNTYFQGYTAGGKNLLPEEGHGWTYGFVWDIPKVDGLSVSADYWHLGIDNAIDNIGIDDVLVDEAGCRTGKNKDGSPYTAHPLGSEYCQLVTANVHRDANGNILAVYSGPINRSKLYVSGIDGTVSYRVKTDRWGDFNFLLEWSDNLRHYQQTLATDPLINDNYNNPKSKVRASLAWHRDNWDATVLGTRTGGVRHNNYGGCETLSDGSQPSVGDSNCVLHYGNTAPWIVYNASVGYQLNEHAKLTFTVNNLFNKLAPIDYYAGGFEFIHTNTGADYVGRELFMDFNYKF